MLAFISYIVIYKKGDKYEKKAFHCQYLTSLLFSPLSNTTSTICIQVYFCSSLLYQQPLIPVKEQMVPDPEFPTVKFPNPEEGKSALDLSFKTANENNSTVILANDPDADRLAIAEKQPKLV